LISDGEDDEMVVARAVDVLKGFGLKLWALGIGTPEGKPIELQGGRLLKNSKQEIVISKLREDTLTALTSGSGGSYARSGVGDEDLEAILADMRSALPRAGSTSTDTEIRIYNEIGPFILWVPLLLLVVLAFMGRQRVIL